MSQPLFIIGPAKSGTTYLRNILDAQPRVFLLQEGLNNLWLEKSSAAEFDLGMFAAEYRECLEKLNRDQPGARYTGDKILFDTLPYLKAWADIYLSSAVKAVVISRDPRDRLVSLRYHEANRDVKNVNYQPLPAAAEEEWFGQWMPRFRKAGFLTVRYEDLFHSPEKAAARIFAYLELPAGQKMIRQALRRAHDFKNIPHDFNPYREGKPGAWRKKMLPEECAVYQSLMDRYAEEYAWPAEPEWMYSSLQPLGGYFYGKGLYKSMSSWKSREFWLWIKEALRTNTRVKQWHDATRDYIYPLMRREYYYLRKWPLPEAARRFLARLFFRAGGRN